MRGYIFILDKAYTKSSDSNVRYIKRVDWDITRDSIHLESTENIEEAMFLPTEIDKERFEASLVYHGKEDFVYIVQAERETFICEDIKTLI